MTVAAAFERLANTAQVGFGKHLLVLRAVHCKHGTTHVAEKLFWVQGNQFPHPVGRLADSRRNRGTGLILSDRLGLLYGELCAGYARCGKEHNESDVVLTRRDHRRDNSSFAMTEQADLARIHFFARLEE